MIEVDEKTRAAAAIRHYVSAFLGSEYTGRPAIMEEEPTAGRPTAEIKPAVMGKKAVLGLISDPSFNAVIKDASVQLAEIYAERPVTSQDVRIKIRDADTTLYLTKILLTHDVSLSDLSEFVTASLDDLRKKRPSSSVENAQMDQTGKIGQTPR